MVAIIINRARNRVVAAVSAVILLLCVACSKAGDTCSEFKTIDSDGWYSTMPLRFSPQVADSSVTSCNVQLAVRHNNSYTYSNLELVVDFIDINHKVDRRRVNFKLADEHGNWLGTGFGSLYQVLTPIAQDVNPDSLLEIVVWHTMKGIDKVEDIENVGVIITSNN